MQFENDFVVPVPPDRAWEALLDLEQVAQCMPGATLLGNDGQSFAGKVKVKVGPITVGYKGSAEFVEQDAGSYRAVLRASGREERGAGTAGATVTAQLHAAEPGQTRVQVLTELDITGRPAQFGRGVMEEVGTAIIGQFAKRLATQLESDDPPAAPNGKAVSGTAAAPFVASPSVVAAPNPPSRPSRDEDALDLGMLAWKPTLKRFAPLVAGVLGLLVLGRLLPRQPKAPQVIVVYGPPADRA